MRSIWKGHIRFSLVTIPVRIYNAVDTEETIRFQQLHKEDNGAVGYEKKCKKCGKTLTADEIVKGYEFEPEQYVIVTAEDFAKIKLQSTKVIEIEGFIDAAEVHPTLYEAPYLAGPDGAVAAKTYSLLSQALAARFTRALLPEQKFLAEARRVLAPFEMELRQLSRLTDSRQVYYYCACPAN